MKVRHLTNQEEFKHAREEARRLYTTTGMSRVEIADELHISSSSIHRYLSGLSRTGRMKKTNNVRGFKTESKSIKTPPVVLFHETHSLDPLQQFVLGELKTSYDKSVDRLTKMYQKAAEKIVRG
jgi:transposase